MPSEHEINRILNLHIKEYGGEKFVKTAEDIMRMTKGVDLAFRGLKPTLAQTTIGFNQLVTSVDKGVGIFNALTRPLGLTSIGLTGIIKLNYDLARAYRVVGAEFSKYGVGFDQLTRRIDDFAVKHRMLRTEVLDLAKAYEHGFIAAATNFENFLGLLEHTVGNNAQAMAALQQNIQGLSQEYLGFGRVITTVSDESGNLNDLQKTTLKQLLALGEASGKVGIQQRKMIQDILAAQGSGSSFLSEADKTRKQQLDRQINSFRTLEQTVERISVQLGEGIMPVLSEIGDFVQKFNSETVKWAVGITAVVGGLQAIKGVGNVLTGVFKLFGFEVGKILGMLRIMPGLAARAGSTVAGGVVAGGGSGALAGAASGALGAGVAVAGGALLGSGIAAGVNYLGTRQNLGDSDRIRGAQNQSMRDMLNAKLAATNNEFEKKSITARLAAMDTEDALYAERRSKINGPIDAWRNAFSGGAENRKTTKEIELERTLAVQRQIAQREEKRAKDAGEQLKRLNEIEALERSIKQIAEESTALRQMQTEDFEIARQNLEAQRNLLQQQLSLYSSIADRVRTTGSVFAGGYLESTQAIVSAEGEINEFLDRNLALRNQIADRIRYAGQLSVQDAAAAKKAEDEAKKRLETATLQLEALRAQKSLIADPSSDDGLANARKIADAQSEQNNALRALIAAQQQQEAVFKAESEAAGALKNNIEAHNSAIKQGAELWRGIITGLDVYIQRQEAAVSLAEAQVSLADNLSMGLAASAEMRMEAVRQMGTTIDLLRNKMELIDRERDRQIENRNKAQEAMSAAKQSQDEVAAKRAFEQYEMAQGSLIGLATERLNLESTIYGKMQQQASMLRALREGYISAIAAMNTGAGVFSKIIIDQNKNLGTLLRSTGSVPIAIRTGSDAGGFRTTERFTPGGISSSPERRRYPIVRPEWGLDSRNAFSGLNGVTLGSAAEVVSAKIADRVDNMSAEAAAVSSNTNNISRLLGGLTEQMTPNLQEARNAVVDIKEKIVNFLDLFGLGNKKATSPSPAEVDFDAPKPADKTLGSVLSSAEKREIARMITKEVTVLVKEALVASKEDIMSDIAKGIG